MAPTYFPLRWESTGDQWWYASPIDWAAANGHYDVVRELLHLDTNLLVKLSSLPRLRRLETVWDDDNLRTFNSVAICRAQVAYKLLRECESTSGHNSLIRAGYGGWLLYTAASAGDLAFVNDLLERDPFLVFGEGEYGLTDILYAAARGKSCEVFRRLLDCAVKDVAGDDGFRADVMNRGVHAACRGGNVEMLTELLGGDGLLFRDTQGSTPLHSAAGRGQLEVVQHLISSYDNIIDTPDNQGNTALHLAAYRGHLPVVEALISASPSSISLTNNYGDTFLHMAVAGFCAPSFRRMDRLRVLMKELVAGTIVNIEDIINVQNKDGRTALHMAVIDNIQSDMVELLMSARYINLNIRDADGNTPLDILKQNPQSASSEILIKRLISAGGISDCRDRRARRAIVSHLNTHRGIGSSPGTSFKIPDSEIFLHAGIEDHAMQRSYDSTSIEYGYSGEIERAGLTSTPKYKKGGSINRLMNVLRWPNKREKNLDTSDSENRSLSGESYRTAPVSLRQQYSRASSLPSNKRISAFPGNPPSPLTKKKFTAGLSHGVLRVQPKGAYFGSPRSAFSGDLSWASPANGGGGSVGPSQSANGDKQRMKRGYGSLNLRLMNKYLCFGAHGLAVEEPMAAAGPPP